MPISIPPPGQGPVIASYEGNRVESLKVALCGALLITAVLSLGRGLSWMGLWQTWLTLCVFALGIYASSRKVKQCYAGVDWLARGKKWVSTSHLTSAECHARRTELEILLADKEGRSLEVDLSVLQKNPVIWESTRKAIIDSIASGAASSNDLMTAILHEK